MSDDLIGYQFGGYELNLLDSKVTHLAQTLALSERSFHLLQILAQSSPNLVSKDELLAKLWPDRVVSDWALARLISDTRKSLGDTGEQQSLIKTARGQGYRLQSVQPVHAQAESEKNAFATVSSPQSVVHVAITPSKSRYWKKVLISFMAIAAFAFIFQYLSKQQLINDVNEIAKQQTLTYTYFKAQLTRRKELVDMIEQRLNIKKARQYEKFFAYYHRKMNKEELFLFHQIREITKTGLFPSNKAIFELLENNTEIYKKIPKTKALYNHLKFWLNKYQAVFKNREDMCLLYVGVEDGAPYPSGVDQAVKDWLQTSTQ